MEFKDQKQPHRDSNEMMDQRKENQNPQQKREHEDLNNQNPRNKSGIDNLNDPREQERRDRMEKEEKERRERGERGGVDNPNSMRNEADPNWTQNRRENQDDNFLDEENKGQQNPNRDRNF